MVADRLRVKLGDDVLIAGASGGIDQATLQLAKLAGARVIATTGMKAKAIARLGADAVIVTQQRGPGVQGRVAAHEQRRRRPRRRLHRQPPLLRFIGSVMRLGGAFVVTSEQGREGPAVTAADLIRLELNLRGRRGARMNDSWPCRAP